MTTNTTAAPAATQPEALRLASLLNALDVSPMVNIKLDNAAAELRRLHALTTSAPAAQEAEPAPSGNPPDCDPELYAHGVSVGLFDVPKWTAEALCRGISAATGARVDWHYVGGRVHVKALPAIPARRPQADAGAPTAEPDAPDAPRLIGVDMAAGPDATAYWTAAEPAPLTQAARDVLTERRRQVEAEGWTPEHDDRYPPGTMARAAGCYATINTYPTPTMWPWASEWWKPRDDRSNYVRAAALLLAELERHDRAAARARQEGGGA